MNRLRTTGILLMLLPTLGVAQNLTFSLAAQPPLEGVISTQNTSAVTVTTLPGHSVHLARQSGRDYRLQASGGFYWTQVQELPEDADALVITPELQEDGSVIVAVDVSRKSGTRRQSYSATLALRAGEWVQLYGPSPRQNGAVQGTTGTTIYGTRQASQDSLFLRLESHAE